MKKRTIAIIACAAVLLIIIIAVEARGGTNYQFVPVTQGMITETVSVTGNTTPVQSLDLAFQNGGSIATVSKQAGDSVNQGDVIATLNTADLQAQLAQAQANVASAQANLSELQAGPTTQSVQVSQAAVATAEQKLANDYAGADDSVTAAFAKANDAVRNQISAFYTNAEGTNPQLTFSVTDNQILNNAISQRVAASTELNHWQTELAAIGPSSSSSTLDAALTSASNHLAVVETLLETLSAALVNNGSLSQTTASTYKSDISTAVTEVEDGSGSVSGLQQSIASDNAALAQAQAQLNVTLAGSTPQAIAAQAATVAQAQASEQSAQAKLSEATLISPISGTVTVQNAKVGEIASPGQVMTSIISASNLEVDADVPETDIGKVAVGNPVDMTFDAFPNENFTGKIFYIDPAETIVGGVVDYHIKVSFDTPDVRIKSGLTANLDIQAKTDQNVLILPQYAVIQNASGTYVEVLQSGKATQIPVTLGIQDDKGNVEVLSGVNAGEQVINIGLKPQ